MMNVAQKEQICIYVMGVLFTICYVLQVTFAALFKAAGPASAGAM